MPNQEVLRGQTWSSDTWFYVEKEEDSPASEESCMRHLVLLATYQISELSYHSPLLIILLKIRVSPDFESQQLRG